MTPTVFIFHKDCFDGFGAAWLYERYEKCSGEEVHYHPAAYKTQPPYDICKGADVIIADFSYPREQLELIQEIAASLIIFDHHKTAEEALAGFPDTLFDMKRSGAGIIADEYGCRNWLVNAVEDRDLWKFELPQTKAIIAALSVVPFEFGPWNSFFERGPGVAADEGIGILKYISNYGKKAYESRRFEMIGGHLFPIINTQYMNCSEHLDLMMDLEKCDLAASFFRRGDGFWQFSLRSRGDLDVSAIAKSYGGGGHKNAAGFEVEKLPWDKHDWKSRHDDAIAKMKLLAEYVESEDGVFTFPDGDYINTKIRK